MELARHASAAQLERLVRSYRGVVAVETGEADKAYEERYLTWSWEEDGSLLVRGRLPAEDGALLLRALEAARDQLRERGAETAPAAPAAHENASAEAPVVPPVGDIEFDQGNSSAEVGAEVDSTLTAAESPSACASSQAPHPAEPPHPTNADTSDSAEPRNTTNADALGLMAETLLASGARQRPAVAAGSRSRPMPACRCPAAIGSTMGWPWRVCWRATGFCSPQALQGNSLEALRALIPAHGHDLGRGWSRQQLEEVAMLRLYD